MTRSGGLQIAGRIKMGGSESALLDAIQNAALDFSAFILHPSSFLPAGVVQW
jgi:hypothetical protein